MIDYLRPQEEDRGQKKRKKEQKEEKTQNKAKKKLTIFAVWASNILFCNLNAP